MNLHRLAAGLCLSLLLCSPLSAEENALPAKGKVEASQSSASGDTIQDIERKNSEKSRKDAFDALPEWEMRVIPQTTAQIVIPVVGRDDQC